ncbi:hypothetical protein LINGRAHAP2_LOCUS33727 [Linum grandiflorum]
MDHYYISSSSSIPAKRNLGAAVLVLMVGCISHDMFVAGELCFGDLPAGGPIKYSSWVQKVMNKLVTQTPTSSTNMFKTYYPDKNNGSATGAATCYTTDEGECRTCLQGIKAVLKQCVQRAAGGYFGVQCNMEFWEVGSIH